MDNQFVLNYIFIAYITTKELVLLIKKSPAFVNSAGFVSRRAMFSLSHTVCENQIPAQVIILSGSSATHFGLTTYLSVHSRPTSENLADMKVRNGSEFSKLKGQAQDAACSNTGYDGSVTSQYQIDHNHAQRLLSFPT